MKKTILYYSNGILDGSALDLAVKRRIAAARLPIVSVTQTPAGFGDNIVVNAGYSSSSIIRQIIAGLEHIGRGTVFFAEHDVLYDLSHWRLAPTAPVAYNTNYWRCERQWFVKRPPERVVLSMLIGDCAALLAHFKALSATPRILEPKRGDDDVELLESAAPCIDVRHPFCTNFQKSAGRRVKFLPGVGRSRGLRKHLNITFDFVW